MRIIKFLLFCTTIICWPDGFVFAQQKTDPISIKNKMEWFEDAKLGIFIHWGIYSVKGIDESWSFYNKKITYDDYMDQLKGFTASNYNPEEWAEIIAKSGAKYAVITTKHHDGVSLFETKYKVRSIPEKSKAKRDLIKPLFSELRKKDIKCGAYFSLLDWSHPDYTGFLKDSSRYSISSNISKWEKFCQFNLDQIDEISKQLNPDLFWFDGDWEHNASDWKASQIRNQILEHNANAIINGRLQGYGDYETPEQNIPISRPAYPWWELCMTLNNNWGWQPQDTAWKTPFEIISLFSDVIGLGGNLLLDIGPREDGTIPSEAKFVLGELGGWCSRNKSAIYNTRAGLPNGFFHGASTMSIDSTILYLFAPGNCDSQIVLKGLKNKIIHTEILNCADKITPKIVGKISWSEVPGRVFITIPSNCKDPYMTVVKLTLDGPIKLYFGAGGFH